MCSLLVVTGLAIAAPPEPATLRPLAVRGGVLALPLRTPPIGEGLPARVAVTVEMTTGAITLDGRVVWLGEPPPAPGRRWTHASNPLAVRSVGEGDDPRVLFDGPPDERLARIDGPILLVQLPPTTGEPRVLLGQFEIEPVWLDPGSPPIVDATRIATWRDDRPDPVSPFEWFRWTLIADARDEPAPPPPGDEGSQLLALSVAELWRAGLARVERRSAGVADALRRWLTATAREPGGERSVAAWISDPADLSSLLSILLDVQRDDETIMQAALAWMDARTPLLLWVDSDADGEIAMAIVNPLEREVLVRMQWLGEGDPPLGELIKEHSIARIRFPRPARATLGASAGGEDPEPIVLAIVAEHFTKRVAFAPGPVAARPPSLSLGLFVPALSLAEARAGRLGAVPAEWSTIGSIRLRAGRWELFFECVAPADFDRSEDAIRCRVGNREVVVYGDGQVEAGGDPVAVSVRDLGDRWRARVELPVDWLPPLGADSTLRIGCRREAGPHRATAVLPVPAWSNALPMIEIDLGVWQDVARP